MNKNAKRTNARALPAHLHILLLSVLVVILTSCLLSPIYTQIENDVTFMYTLLPIILDYAILLFETIYLSLLFAVVSYAVYGFYKGEESKTPNIVYIIAVVVLKHVLNLAVSSIIDSYIDAAFDIPVTLLLLLADTLTLAVVWLIAGHKCKKHFAHAKRMKKASKYLNTIDYDESAAIYPFNGFFNLKNPIIFPIFVGSLISVAALIIQRLYADFIVLGAPASFYEVIEIILAYLIDILLELAGYAAAYFAASYIFVSQNNAEISDQTNEQ